MKKMICVLLVMTCLFSMISQAFADRSAWPVISLSGYGTTLKPSKDEKRRYQSTFGPGRGYPGAGAYKPYKVTSMTALMREGEYVLVDMSYQTVGRRILYFKDSSLTSATADEFSFSAHSAATTTTVQPMFGPGYAYDEVQDQNGHRITLGSGNRVSVFFEADGWVFAEFSCALGMIRAWLPADQVE